MADTPVGARLRRRCPAGRRPRRPRLLGHAPRRARPRHRPGRARSRSSPRGSAPRPVADRIQDLLDGSRDRDLGCRRRAAGRGAGGEGVDHRPDRCERGRDRGQAELCGRRVAPERAGQRLRAPRAQAGPSRGLSSTALSGAGSPPACAAGGGHRTATLDAEQLGGQLLVLGPAASAIDPIRAGQLVEGRCEGTDLGMRRHGPDDGPGSCGRRRPAPTASRSAREAQVALLHGAATARRARPR